MVSAMSGSGTTPSEAGVRARLLIAADELFYAEGIHAVGIDRVLTRAGVAKASLYHHFESKDDLVVAYLDARSVEMSRSLRDRLTDVAGDAHPRVVAIFEGIWDSAARGGFHGCPFINAAAEFPRAEHPVRRAIARHRQRFAAVISEQLSLGGLEPAPTLVEAILVTYDGAMVSAQVDGKKVAQRAAQRILDALLVPGGVSPSAPPSPPPTAAAAHREWLGLAR